MPIYEFYCAKCREKFEKLSRSGALEHPCPICGETATRAVSVPAAALGGAGGGNSCGGGSTGFT
ncbi:putative FmdB family regulatory protein [Geothermobacter ehrlichii]|uniref:Putative FmdB family regulatory protein n=1 Tax=Geothermobacter ehrlichii TaxID=213224 RepID=A0A5D3WNH7_9BACT|nr:zinc ribbon domain-containing protein [Geothermobacter ehrlichii]TYP00108.1 putative FmdB family regulatory protein [Geothermobacter ehrlichii]